METITPTLAFFFEVSQASYVQEDEHNVSFSVILQEKKSKRKT